MDFSQRFRSLRTERGLTQADIAERLGLTNRAVGAWESGRSRPRLDKLNQLAEMLGVKVSDLLGEDYDGTPFAASGTMVPLLGSAHMGDFEDEGSMDELIEIPTGVAERHPRGFLIHAQGSCMDRRYPADSYLLIDPDMEPVTGGAVLAESEDYGAVVRVYTRGTFHTFLAADSWSGEHPDIMAGPDDPPITVKGVVVWYMASEDLRRGNGAY